MIEIDSPWTLRDYANLWIQQWAESRKEDLMDLPAMTKDPAGIPGYIEAFSRNLFYTPGSPIQIKLLGTRPLWGLLFAAIEPGLKAHLQERFDLIQGEILKRIRKGCVELLADGYTTDTIFIHPNWEEYIGRPSRASIFEEPTFSSAPLTIYTIRGLSPRVESNKGRFVNLDLSPLEEKRGEDV